MKEIEELASMAKNQVNSKQEVVERAQKECKRRSWIFATSKNSDLDNKLQKQHTKAVLYYTETL